MKMANLKTVSTWIYNSTLYVYYSVDNTSPVDNEDDDVFNEKPKVILRKKRLPRKVNSRHKTYIFYTNMQYLYTRYNIDIQLERKWLKIENILNQNYNSPRSLINLEWLSL